MNAIEKSWSKLARLAARAADDSPEIPFGFAMRTVAAWKASSPESLFAALERLIWRGLAIALVIFGGCAALGYDALASVISGEVAQAGNYLSELLGI